ncbi:hypothetical protein KBD68_04105 [Candidatus Woesebacteria bacterium]|nr:hypothetical protein [Candidatus Woesebacteria bacterium]
MDKKIKVTLTIKTPEDPKILEDEKIQALLKKAKQLEIEAREIKKAWIKRIGEIKKL